MVGAALGGVDPAAELHPLPHQHLEDAYGVPRVCMNTFTVYDTKYKTSSAFSPFVEQSVSPEGSSATIDTQDLA